jgi:hypothetical protein
LLNGINNFNPLKQRISDQEYLYCRLKTIGVTDKKIIFKGHDIVIYDFGGQRNERKVKKKIFNYY